MINGFDDIWCHVITRDECGPNFLTFVIRRRENPGKNSTRKLTRPGIGPGPLHERHRPYTIAKTLRLYRAYLNPHYRLSSSVVGNKTVKFFIGTHVRKYSASPLQTKYHHITCWTLPLLLITVRCFSSGSTRRARCYDQLLHHMHGTYVPCSGKHDYQ